MVKNHYERNTKRANLKKKRLKIEIYHQDSGKILRRSFLNLDLKILISHKTYRNDWSWNFFLNEFNTNLLILQHTPRGGHWKAIRIKRLDEICLPFQNLTLNLRIKRQGNTISPNMQVEKLYLSKKSMFYVTKVHTCNDPAILATVGYHLPPCSDNVHCVNKRNKMQLASEISVILKCQKKTVTFIEEKKYDPITL